MLIRRALYYWQFPAAIVLPVWLLVGFGVFGQSALGLLPALFGAFACAIGLAIVGGIIRARVSARESRAVSWRDAGMLAAWQLAIVGVGFHGPASTLFGVLAVVLGLAAFWLTLWELLTDVGRRVRVSLGDFGAAQQTADPSPSRPSRLDDGFDGDIIVVPEKP